MLEARLHSARGGRDKIVRTRDDDDDDDGTNQGTIFRSSWRNWVSGSPSARFSTSVDKIRGGTRARPPVRPVESVQIFVIDVATASSISFPLRPEFSTGTKFQRKFSLCPPIFLSFFLPS